jgi:hypothetical protein
MRAQFDDAEHAFQAVVEDRESTKAFLAEALRYLAALRLSNGDRRGAHEAAIQAVSLDPEAAPPEGAPSAASRLFSEARSEIGDTGLRCELAVERRDERARALVSVTGDPGQLARSAVVMCGSTEARAALVDARAELDVDAPAARCRASIETDLGVEIASADAALAPRVTPAPPEAATARDEGGRFPWLWVGVGAGVAAAVLLGAVLLSGGATTAEVGEPVAVEP